MKIQNINSCNFNFPINSNHNENNKVTFKGKNTQENSIDPNSSPNKNMINSNRMMPFIFSSMISGVNFIAPMILAENLQKQNRTPQDDMVAIMAASSVANLGGDSKGMMLLPILWAQEIYKN